MSPEYDLLDHLLGEDYSLAFLCRLFDSKEHYCHSVMQMLVEGDVRLIDSEGNEVPKWKWRELLTDTVDQQTNYLLSITRKGIALVG